jgi:hypothetical protein
MNATRLAGIALVAAGSTGLLYGDFRFTKETYEARLGPIARSVSEKRSVNVPVWAGVAGVMFGGLLLVLGSKKR